MDSKESYEKSWDFRNQGKLQFLERNNGKYMEIRRLLYSAVIVIMSTCICLCFCLESISCLKGSNNACVPFLLNIVI